MGQVHFEKNEAGPALLAQSYMNIKTLYTIGHSNNSLEHFIDLLRLNQINAIADVRSWPRSKLYPHFNRDVLGNALAKHKIAYVFLGRELGARPTLADCYINGKVSYARLAAQSEFHDGLNRVRQGIEHFNLALLCAEKEPIVCHRMILVCRYLREPALDIRHIQADGSLESNNSAEDRLCKTLNLQTDLFTSREEVVEMAYERQGERIAYSQKQEAPAEMEV